MRILLLISLVLLSGCMMATSKTAGNVYKAGKDGVKEDTLSFRSRISRYIFPEQDVSPPVAAEEPSYCYKTIADVNCYTEPQRGEEERLQE